MRKKLNSILFIDDDEATNFVNTIIVEKANCANAVNTVTSGSEALTFLKSVDVLGNYPHPDLIFIDINMPVMNGWEFIEEYQKLLPQQRGNVLVYMLTSSNNPDDKIRAKEFNCDGFMEKPLSEHKLHDLIQEHFPEVYKTWEDS